MSQGAVRASNKRRNRNLFTEISCLKENLKVNLQQAEKSPRTQSKSYIKDKSKRFLTAENAESAEKINILCKEKMLIAKFAEGIYRIL